MTDNRWPELHDKPRSRVHKILKRLIVTLLIAGTVAASLIYAYRDSGVDAGYACAATVQSKGAQYTSSMVVFEVFGRGGVGWECYAYDRDHQRHHIVSLGLSPAFVDLPIGIDT